MDIYRIKPDLKPYEETLLFRHCAVFAFAFAPLFPVIGSKP
jgi:hypothetical protein